jgi:Protein of unknown function (DUF3263)
MSRGQVGRAAPDRADLRIEGILARVPQQPAPREEPREEPGDWLAEAFEPLSEPSDEPAPSTKDDKSPLGEREREILAFERKWWKHAGAKDQAIRDRFQLSSTRYYQLLNRLLDDPDALAHDPILVQRLRRLRATRSRARGR